MAKKLGKLAVRYATALLNLVEKENGRSGDPTPAEKVAASLAEFASLWAREEQIPAVLLNPMFTRKERLAVLERLGKLANLPDVAERFLRVLLERDRLSALPEIATALVERARERAGVVRVEIATARSIDSSEQKDVETELRAYIKGQPEFRWRVDERLLGGMVVQYGGKVIDGSLAGRLERLERALIS